MADAAGLRERKKARTRREIVEAALELFQDRGYDETRVQDIIERVGISEGTFFNYFPTKESLLHDFALAHMDIYREALRYELEDQGVGVPDRIRHLMRAAALAIERDRDLQEVVYTRSDLFNASGTLRDKTLRMYDEFAELFRSGQERGEIRRDADSLQLAEILSGIYHLTTVNWLTRWWGSEERLENRLIAAVDLFLDGCRPG